MSVAALPEVRVLGQLLLMQSVVTSLPDDSIIQFVTQGLVDIPGVTRVQFRTGVCADEEAALHFRLTCGASEHGELLFGVSDATAFAPYADHIRNFAFMLAVILEERSQRRTIDAQYRHLEQRVAKRTAELARERDTAQGYLDIAGVMLMALDRQGRILMVNRKGAELLGQAEESLIGVDWFENFLPARERAEVREVFDRLMAADTRLVESYENVIVTRAGQLRIMAWNNTLLRDEAGTVTGTLSSAEDVTERRQADEKIKELAFFDQLTSLPNRTLLLDRLKQTMASCLRSACRGALLFIDLDHFKSLNDTLGHDTGDILLQQVAQRLRRCVREEDTVARLGGDEFVVILAGLNGSAEDAAAGAEVVAHKILSSLNDVYHLGHVAQRSTASVGVTLFDGAQATAEDLMKQADLAMYRSKDAGRNLVRFFDPTLESAVTERVRLEGDLRRALAETQFLLHYQAQVGRNGRLCGAEALLRWQSPRRGLVAPRAFIRLTEETGLILPLGLWVLDAACRQLAAWAKQPEMAHLTIAVNVSARQFHEVDIVDQVLKVIQRTGARPERLKLELTESLLLDNVSDAAGKISALKARGVGFSLDDFGTGYSSLSYLRRLPLDELKIDQSFVRDIVANPSDAAIARTIVALGQSLGLDIIAEGVEREEQRDFLASIGCFAYQGYLHSRPLPAEGFEALVRRSSCAGRK
ncbi:EAL domain-containing protein [Accumulibacter sp.]|uniref:putative bifunctional diguanylate cyclase/phosphodiesterase n=1 Tax=Accumulibacter sp. TaxID=2053492 RepID=UPI002A6F654F|nr:EAL domain-containing protein [Accumulibacter sp.]